MFLNSGNRGSQCESFWETENLELSFELTLRMNSPFIQKRTARRRSLYLENRAAY